MSNSLNISMSPDLELIMGPGYDVASDCLERLRGTQEEIKGVGFSAATDGLSKVHDDVVAVEADVATVDAVVDAIRATDVVNIQANIDDVETDVGVVGAAVIALNDISTAQVNAEVDNALNTAIPGSPTAGSINDVLKDVDSKTLPDSRVYSETDDLLFSNDAEKGDNQASYTIEKIILCGVNGILRIKFDLKYTGGAGSVYGRIYKNGVAFGTEQTNSSSTYVTYSEDLAFVANDRIELWGKNGTTSFSFQNFRVYGVMYNLFLNTLI